MMFRLSQVSIAIAVLATLNSCLGIWGHVSDPQYPLHAQFHMTREIFLNLSILSILTFVMFGSKKLHTPAGWGVLAIGLLIMTGSYWAGLLITGASIPNFGAGLNHVLNTIFGVLALAFSWKHFNGDQR